MDRASDHRRAFFADNDPLLFLTSPISLGATMPARRNVQAN